MRGRPGCPTGQEKHSVGATGGSPLFLLLQGKVGYRVAPSSDPASPGHLWFMVASPGPDRTVPRTVRPPRGRLWRLSFAKMLSSIFSLENASQIGLGIPEETAPLSYQRQRSPKRASESERAINPGSRGLPLVFFPPAFFQRKPGSPAVVGGEPTLQGPPCNGSNGTACR